MTVLSSAQLSSLESIPQSVEEDRVCGLSKGMEKSVGSELCIQFLSIPEMSLMVTLLAPSGQNWTKIEQMAPVNRLLKIFAYFLSFPFLPPPPAPLVLPSFSFYALD